MILKDEKEIVEKSKNMDEEFEQNQYSRTTKSFCRVRHESIRLRKWMA